jgi:hypothetical protein
MINNVLILQVSTTVDIDHVRDKLASLMREIARWCKWVRESRLHTFIIITEESSLELRNRLSPFLIDKAGISAFYCCTASDDWVGYHGSMDAVRFHIDEARLEIRERSHPENMAQRDWRRRWSKRPVQNVPRNTVVKMPTGPYGLRKPPQNADGK